MRVINPSLESHEPNYAGKLTRWMAEFRLRSVHSRPGDFLVRESESQDGFVVISSNNPRNVNGVRHVLVRLAVCC